MNLKKAKLIILIVALILTIGALVSCQGSKNSNESTKPDPAHFNNPPKSGTPTLIEFYADW